MKSNSRVILFSSFFLLWTQLVRAQNFTIGMDQWNVAYVGLRNQMTITIENTKIEDVVLTTDNGNVTITDRDRGTARFYYLPEKTGFSTINVGVHNQKGIKQIGKYQVRVKQLPPPTPYLLGRKEGTINKPELCNAIGPRAPYGYDGAICGSAQILEFTIYISRNNEIIYSKGFSDFKGAIFDDETRDFFGILRNGDIVWLTNFELQCFDGKKRATEDIKLTVVTR